MIYEWWVAPDEPTNAGIQVETWRAQIRDTWPDAPVQDTVLDDLISAAIDQCVAYAPAWPEFEDVTSRHILAVAMQARELWLATRREGDGVGIGPEGFTIRARPMTGTVKRLLRPARAVPRLG